MSRRLLTAIAVLSVTALLALPAAAQQRDLADALLGPLPVRDQYLLNNGFFFFEPESAHVLDEDSWVVDVHTADSNTFAKSRWISHNLEGDTERRSGAQTLSLIRIDDGTTVFLVDGEIHRTTITAHFGYWTGLAEQGKALAFGPVDDPSGVYGIGIVLAEHQAEAEALRDRDPALLSPHGFRTEIAPMSSLVTPGHRFDR